MYEAGDLCDKGVAIRSTKTALAHLYQPAQMNSSVRTYGSPNNLSHTESSGAGRRQRHRLDGVCNPAPRRSSCSVPFTQAQNAEQEVPRVKREVKRPHGERRY